MAGCSDNTSWLNMKIVPDKNRVIVVSRVKLNNGKTLSVLQANITDVQVDAIVTQYHLTGMIETVSNRGGLLMETLMSMSKHQANGLSNLKTCEANISNASKNLLCKKIIQVNSPKWFNINDLKKCVENILLIAEEHKLDSIALPNIIYKIFAGNGDFKQIQIQTIIQAVHSHFKVIENNPALPKSSICDVFFVVNDSECINLYTSELEKLNIQ